MLARRRWLAVGLALSLIVVSAAVLGRFWQPVRMPVMPKTALPGQIARVDPLTCPTVPAHPSQAEQGAYDYCQVCMTCHGDTGQGLDGWRHKLKPPDNNCYQSTCHGARHPANGFVLPDEVPPIVGPGVLDEYQNAQFLHDYIADEMPWWKPGYLKPKQYWNLTAFLLQANGIDTGSLELSETNAAEIQIKTK